MPDRVEILIAGAPATGKTDFATALALALPQSGLCVYRDQQPTGFDLVFVMGLDESANSQREQKTQQKADTKLRATLSQQSVAFQVLYGSTSQRLEQALKAIGALRSKAGQALNHSVIPSDPQVGQSAQPWVWPCDKCSDPQCEHLLFSRLLA